MRAALDDVINGMSIRAAAKRHNLNYNTLNRKHKKLDGATEIPDDMQLISKYNHQQIFSEENEKELADYVQERSDLGHGLFTEQIRKLAFDFAVANNITVPPQWLKNNTAGKEWLMSFTKRRKVLSLRIPQGFSNSRAACFNKVNIESYFLKLQNALHRHPTFSSGERVFNADETGTTTVGANTRKVMATKGVRQVHQAQSHERGESITSMFFVCANGTFIPPVMLFPRMNYNPGMVKDCYPGTKGIAAGKKGYMNNNIMVEALKHFIDHTKSSKDNPSMLILDNFGSHMTLEVIMLCRENGVMLFTLPPHTTHKT